MGTISIKGKGIGNEFQQRANNPLDLLGEGVERGMAMGRKILDMAKGTKAYQCLRQDNVTGFLKNAAAAVMTPVKHVARLATAPFAGPEIDPQTPTRRPGRGGPSIGGP